MYGWLQRWMEEEKLMYRPVRKSDSTRPVYIRFGRFSRTGERSMNHANGKYEKGISVYRAQLTDGLVSLVDDPNLQLTPEDCAHLLRGRLVFVVTGREQLHCGSDGEPLLTGIQLLPFAVDFNSLPEKIKQGERSS